MITDQTNAYISILGVFLPPAYQLNGIHTRDNSNYIAMHL